MIFICNHEKEEPFVADTDIEIAFGGPATSSIVSPGRRRIVSVMKFRVELPEWIKGTVPLLKE